MKRSRIGLVLGCAVALLAMVAPEADAIITAKVKCRVGTPPRVQIGAAGEGLAANTDATITVSNGISAQDVYITAPADGQGDLDVEWDSAIDPADPEEGVRASISSAFVGVGGTVTATVSQGAATSASTTCVAK